MANERRVKCRYPIELTVRYQALGVENVVPGVGQTLNISSSGMLLACNSVIAEGTRLKMYVEWPSLLNGTTPLQLITVGTVVRSTESGVSIVFESYQFRTMARARAANITAMPARSAPAFDGSEPERLTLIAKTSS